MTLGRLWVAAALCAPVLVAGCSSDEPRPKMAPPSESSSPTATPAAEPEAWERRSRAGAAAFVDRWLTVFNSAAASGETDALVAISGPDCQTCSNFVSFIDDIHSNGGSFESDGWRMKSFSFAKPGLDDEVTVAVNISQPAEIIRRPGESPERSEPGEVTYQADLRWEGMAWSMDALTLVSS